MTSIDRGAAPSSMAKHVPDPVPGLLIGRLAVDRSVAGLGIGTALVARSDVSGACRGSVCRAPK